MANIVVIIPGNDANNILDGTPFRHETEIRVISCKMV